MNSTIFGVKEQNKNKLEFLFKPLPRLNDQNGEFNCPVIEVVDTLIKEITIKFTIPEILNYVPLEVITTQCIFQFLKAHSTNRILPTYHVFVENNFIVSQEKDEPLKRKFGNCLKLNGTTFRFTSIE
uniref:Uncharacterized protein n=1 Tax=Rhizophagus irregularis (strain DAOM 181602 / DAOM 197198 / MUCL 43194) TaxID=747089 RepID=U9TYL4_RHIID